MACPKAVLFQVKYTNQMSHGLTRLWGGKLYDFRPGLRREAWRGGAPARKRSARPCPSLDRIKREKGVWWMPWQQEARKDVIPCDKSWGAGNRL
jgi:hypothetical protein